LLPEDKNSNALSPNAGLLPLRLSSRRYTSIVNPDVLEFLLLKS